MTLQRDRFDGTLKSLTDQGWVITEIKRYDPTVFSGTTPTGRSFTLTAQGTNANLTIANRQQNRATTQAEIEDATAFEAMFNALYFQFPPNQR